MHDVPIKIFQLNCWQANTPHSTETVDIKIYVKHISGNIFEDKFWSFVKIYVVQRKDPGIESGSTARLGPENRFRNPGNLVRESLLHDPPTW